MWRREKFLKMAVRMARGVVGRALEWYWIIELDGCSLSCLGHSQRRHYEQIDDVLPVYEEDLTPLGLIELATDPVSSSLGDFSTRDDVSVIDQDAFAEL